MTVVSVRGPEMTLKSSFGATWGDYYLQDKNIKKMVWYGDLELGVHRASVKIGDELVAITDLFKIFNIWHPALVDDAAKTILTNMMDAKRGDQVEGRIAYWEAIVSKYVEVLNNDMYGLVVLDTWKEAWTANTQSYLETIQKKAKGQGKSRENLGQMEYATPNQRMRAFIQSAKAYKKDLVLISHERPKYIAQVDDKGIVHNIPGPETELDGWKETLDLVDWGFATSFDSECPFPNKVHPDSDILLYKNKTAKACFGGFHSYALITKSPCGAEFKGMRLVNPTYGLLKSFVEEKGRRMI